MGWSTGNYMMSEIIETVEDLVSNYNTRKELYKKLIEIFEDRDADDLYECTDESAAFKEAYQDVHPGSLDEDGFYNEEQE